MLLIDVFTILFIAILEQIILKKKTFAVKQHAPAPAAASYVSWLPCVWTASFSFVLDLIPCFIQ